MSDEMDLDDVAERLRCSTRTVRRRIADGELRAVQVARGRWVITEDDLQAFFDLRATRPREPVVPVPVRPSRPRKSRAREPQRLSDVLRDAEKAA